MASGLSGRLWAGRELVDRMARQSPARLAITVFAAVIAVFTGLLSTPLATAHGVRAPFVDAFFTATSAVCVTGLVTVPTGTYWSGFGQAVILVAIKVGGLGVMTLASVLGMAVSRRIGLTQKLLTASETKTTRLGEVGSLIRVVIITSTTLEVLIAALLIPRFLALNEGVGEAFWHGVFYAVSAFNNAGFIPTAHGLAPHAGDWLLLMPIIIGAFIGALGFPVILNVARNRKKFVRWSLHAKLTVVTSSLLVVIGSTLFVALEWMNSGTLGAMSIGDKILNGLFMGVMPRSAGFSTIDVGQMREASWLITDSLMFVGGGSASTAGGIKVTTLAVMLIAIIAEARGDRDVEVFGRRIPRETLRLAVAVVFVGATAVLVACLLLLEITGWSLDVVLFEVISAFATVGLSTGVTHDLPEAGKYVLIALMFIGRTGTMTLAAALALRDRRRVIRLPEERPIIG
ncbi:potassium uptake protein, TrkH family [Sanguibacter gelidistatuariae]|uniref:Potassium uptake protein, TrkH family n=1 Tax=Sanguibacter gelidistatuariae TaxID=1814289 RepID=A0A1G6X800_9MICO|nr:potassium transporter TrkG [Sanguibacter gelidistatuariae]SDD74269.1 potassium uptake protein, TrkH family [Sanguibacter gelidistatuariae]